MSSYKVPVLEKFEWQPSVKDKDLTSPPTSPVKGDRFLLYTTPSGLWAGHLSAIAWFDGVNWEFISPRPGMQCWMDDEHLYYIFTGSVWQIADYGTDGESGYSGYSGLSGYSGAAGVTSLFEIDIDGNLIPVTGTVSDPSFELDGNDDIMPKAAA